MHTRPEGSHTHVCESHTHTCVKAWAVPGARPERPLSAQQEQVVWNSTIYVHGLGTASW